MTSASELAGADVEDNVNELTRAGVANDVSR